MLKTKMMRLKLKVRILVGIIFWVELLACQAQAKPIRILLDSSPTTLNPRATLDASGQRLNAMTLLALTHLDSQLVPQPELAENWSFANGTGNQQLWKFKLRPGFKDHEGQAITPEKILKCLENYRTLKPISPVSLEYDHWIKSEIKRDELILTLSRRDLYFARNLSLIRYYRVKGSDEPCTEPTGGQTLVGSGRYKITPFTPFPKKGETLLLTPIAWPPESPKLHPSIFADDPSELEFIFMSDENSKGLKIMRGEVDAAPSSISFAKQRWLVRDHADKFKILAQSGTRAFYLAFNVTDPILKNKEVRKAIVYALDRDLFIKTQMAGFGEVSGTLLSPLLKESFPIQIPYDPKLSEALLDQAGYPRKKDGVRFTLKYKTTTAREGYDRAVIFQDMLKKVGIKLELDVVESTVFFALVRKGNFQLFVSSWIGVADAGIFDRSLRSGPKNRYRYGNPEVDKLLDEAFNEMDEKKRAQLIQNIQRVAVEEMPYAALFISNNTIILRNEIEGLKSDQISITGALEPLSRLKRGTTKN